MVNMKTDGINDYDKNDLCKSVENSFYDDVPNLGSVITLDNKGRLINSQFSKPSSSQTLLKLNSSEEVPDADDLPYAVISYGDTPNAMKLPYNDHNYVGSLSNKNLENYDKKALEYTTKQTIQYSQRSNFPTSTNLRISHFSSFNSNCLQQNDSGNNRTEGIFLNEKAKLNNSNQYNFNHNIINTLTPLNANKSINNHPIQHQIQQLQPTNNGFIAKKQILSNAIVINSNNVNKLKGMSVIKLQRSNLESNISNNISITEPRIINVPTQIKKANLSNVLVANDSMTVGTGGVVSGSAMDSEIINPSVDNKSDKTINLIPRCICGFTHDDGGMIRCEICQTWQHIICMYPDNKFPILYKCEKCEPREIDYHRAIATQTNNLRKAGQNASDFLVNHEYQDYENENNTETSSISKSHITPQYVIVQPEMKASYRHIHDSIHTTPNQIYITNSKDSQLVPPGSPRTSKRKQDLISLKTVLAKPNSTAPGSFAVNNVVIHNSNEIQKSLIHNQMNYNCLPNYLIPTSTSPSQLLVEQRPREINETSNKLKYILCNKPQSHTNLTIQQEQYLRLNNFVIHPNHSYEVFRVKFNQHVSNVIRSIVELSCNEIIMEYNGFISLAEDYNKEYDFRKHYNPFALFYEKCDHLSLCIDAKETNSECKYIRRSCTPNAEVKHRLTSNGQIRFYIVPINKIPKDVEITIGFDFNYMKCRYQVECACNQASCELIYTRMEEARSKKMSNLAGQLNEYDNAVYGEQMKNVSVLTRPHKKRGRAAKILNTSNRQTIDKPVSVDANSTAIVRRNKRGRPPLNRPNGIQRADVCLKTSSDSSSNNCLTEFKEPSDNESIPGRTNENIHPNLSLHSNFKNFKRISSSHWSLKAHRKLCASMSKNSRTHKNLITQKVGRPLKYKKEKIVETKKDIDYSSDPASSPERYNGTEKSFDGDGHMSSNEEYERTMFQYSGDMMREEEGKYWLEEINNKIYKQKLKEAKKVKRKNRIEKSLSQKLSNIKSHHHNTYKEEPEIDREPEPEPTNDEIDLGVSQKEFKQEMPIDEEGDVKPPLSPAAESAKDKKHSNLNLICRTKRGRKSLKNNKNYIVSYKTSNIDDLKNDLMLISASLEEEPEPDLESKPVINEKLEDEFPMNNVHMNMEADEAERNLSDSFETKKSSTDMEMEFNNSKFIKNSEEKPPMSYKSKYRKSISNKTTESSKDALKASREERWVNIMWQRILKSENSDNKSKRKRSKSSVADESNPSEENLNDGHELSSPKFGDSDFCDDNLSCDNKDQESCYKLIPSTCKSRRRPNKLKSSSYSDNDKNISFSKSSEITTEIKTETSTASISAEENDMKNHMESQMSEQCGLIVYKEQQANPMEKFSRENSARLFNENYSEGLTLSTNSGTNHPPHAKKRWLSQALLEENLHENTTAKSNDKLNDLFTEKFSNIENSSKHSFLPPVITTVDSTAFTLTPQKVAMNPKKRLLSQFSMEDNAFRISASDVCGEYKSNKWDQNIDQELTKTKLTLSEYRKRRYCDKSSKSTNDAVTGNKILCDINSEWVGLNTKHSYVAETNKEKCDGAVNNSIFSPRSANDVQSQSTGGNQNYKYMDSISKLNIISDSTFISKPNEEVNEQQESLSYLNTLNNLRMPGNLDPRLTKSMAFVSGKQLPRAHQLVESLEKPVYSSSSNVVFHQPCPRSPDETPNSESDWKLISCNDRGPRTPSDIDDLSVNRNIENDCLSAYAPSQESIDTFESQPSPTSDSHFDFDRSDQASCKDNKKSSSVCESNALNDWTNHSTTIGKMAGIQNPDLLLEIEEFDDEYVPLPEKLPERSKEEMETLLLTQKRDSQIREWQEVRQLEREKVKLEHQVRSMQRRMQRVTTKNIVESKLVPSNKPVNDDEQTNIGFVLMTTTDDEKTMKTFNVQLSNLNDRLMEQIHIAKNNNDKSSKATVPQTITPSNIDLPQSYRLQPDIIDIGTTTISKNQSNCDENPNDSNSSNGQAVVYSKFRKRWNNDKPMSQKLPQTTPEDPQICNPPTSSCTNSQTQSDLPFTFITQPKIESLPGVIVTPNSSIPPSISDNVPNFQSVYPEMTSAFM